MFSKQEESPINVIWSTELAFGGIMFTRSWAKKIKLATKEKQ